MHRGKLHNTNSHVNSIDRDFNAVKLTEMKFIFIQVSMRDRNN